MARRRRRAGCNARTVLGCLAVVLWLDTIGLAGVYGGVAWLLAVVATVALLALLIVPSWRRQRAAQAYRQMLRDANIHRIDEMPGPEFEEALRLLFEDLGYQASLTPPVGDFGADLILQRGPERTTVQAKRYGGAVGVKAIQEVAAARQHYGAQRAMVVTNSQFTPAALQLARSTGVELCDRQQLISMLLSVRRPKGNQPPQT